MSWNSGPGFAEYTCPASTCSYSYDSIDYEPIQGESWWQYGDDNNCTTFCHCSSDGTVTCQETYAAIVSDTVLSPNFKYECEDDIADVKRICVIYMIHGIYIYTYI